MVTPMLTVNVMTAVSDPNGSASRAFSDSRNNTRSSLPWTPSTSKANSSPPTRTSVSPPETAPRVHSCDAADDQVIGRFAAMRLVDHG